MSDVTTAPGRADIATRPFVLPQDVLVLPVAELSDRVRASLPGSDGCLAICRPGFRTPSRLVDQATAELLHEFRSPSTIAQAVVRYCRAHDVDPREVLDEAFHTLQLFTSSRILVPEDSPHADGIHTSWAPGQRVLDLEIVALLQATHDTEVYRATTGEGVDVAVKIVQADAPEGTEDAVERETDVLARLGGGSAPRLVEQGRLDGRRFAVISWIDGVPLDARAAEIRLRRQPGWRARLHRLACATADRIAELHAIGIVHGDLHPRNVIVGPDDSVRLIDFGLSVQPDRPAPYRHRARVGFGEYLDRDAARALLEGGIPDEASPITEQYALAALLFSVYTGRPYLEFEPDFDAVYRQIVSDDPLPFARCDVEAWPTIERVLRRALAKEPADRHSTTASFAAALRHADPPAATVVSRRFDGAVTRYVDGTIARIASSHELAGLFGEAPTVAVDRGAAGVAWFLLRIAQLHDRPDLLDDADVWCSRAIGSIGGPSAFLPDAEPDGEASVRIGACSVLHRPFGVFYVQAILHHARHDLAGLDREIERMCRLAEHDDGVADVTLGRSGAVLALANVLETVAATTDLDTTRLVRAIGAGVDRIAEVLGMAEPPGLIGRQPLSYAHGWPGLVDAYVRGCSAIGLDPAPAARTRIDAIGETLAGAAAIARQHIDDVAPSWCNGSAGWVRPLLTLGSTFDMPAWSDAAADAAQHVALHPGRHPHLCCGLAGRIYALNAMHRATGDPGWRERAIVLAQAAVAADDTDQPHSLLRGRLGVALALAELQADTAAAFPLIGDPGWSRHR